MFGWFKPRCPLSTAEKVWVESRMAWLTSTLGLERLHNATVIEPTDEFFPAAYQKREEDAQRIFRQCCKWMGIDAARVSLEIHEQINDEDPLGLYIAGEPARILIQRGQLDDPESLVATAAHELAHEVLLGGGHLHDNNEDLERLTDLTTVFFGLGIFSANSKIREQTVRDGNVSWWSISKQGYLPLRMYGYGLSLFAWARNELLPDWARHLRLDARDSMQKGLRYLRKTGDSVFQIDRPVLDFGEDGPESAAALLKHSSSSFRFHGLGQLIDYGAAPAAAIETIVELTHDRDPDVSSSAATLLGVIGEPASVHGPRLLDMLSSRTAVDRECAAWSLGQIRPAAPLVLRELMRLLDDEHPGVCSAAIEALGNFGHAAQVAEKPLLRLFRQALIECDNKSLDILASVLLQIFPDAPQRVREYFIAIDDELCRMAEDCLAAAQPQQL